MNYLSPNLYSDNSALLKLRADYRICKEMILDVDPLPSKIKSIICKLCHEPIEQTLYDAIIYNVDYDVADDNDYVEKGSLLYYFHTQFNLKLGRISHIRNDEIDKTLLVYIVEEILRRSPSVKESYADEAQKKNLQTKIYQRFRCRFPVYMTNSLDNRAMAEAIALRFDNQDSINKEELVGFMNSYINNPLSSGKDKRFESFYEYFKHLMQENKCCSFNSEHDLFVVKLGLPKRERKLNINPPSKDLLYLICVAMALDYEQYCTLRNFLIIENPEKCIRYLDNQTDIRDEIMKGVLRNIDNWLGDIKKEDSMETNWPSLMVKNINKMLHKRGALDLYGKRQ